MIKNIIPLVITITLLANCETWRSECGGEIVIENPIPDTTLYVEGESYKRDITKQPKVFSHTENKPLSILVTSDDGGNIVDAHRRVNEQTGQASVVEVIPKNEGETSVNILVDDGCGEIEYSFNVTVLDTSQQRTANPRFNSDRPRPVLPASNLLVNLSFYN